MPVIIVILLILIVATIFAMRREKKHNAMLEERKNTLALENISNEIIVKDAKDLKHIFQIDDVNKKFSVDYIIHDFKELINYEYFIDGESIISGRGLETMAGAAAFGVAGAMIGSSGSRTQTNKITTAKIILRLTNVAEPTQTIDINPKKARSKEVEDIISLLQYIKLNADKN